MKRDDERFVEFATARTPHLVRTAYLLTGDWHLAEDLVQEALGRCYATPRGFARIDNPAAYAQTVLMRTFLNHRRRRSSTEVPRLDLPDAGRADADVPLRLSLLAALDELFAKDRAVVVLRYWDDRSVAETAELLGLTAAAVRNQALRALAKPRDVLGDGHTDFTELLSS
jgi:RNA polymerase sigma-70 factor (sigma-E family)